MDCQDGIITVKRTGDYRPKPVQTIRENGLVASSLFARSCSWDPPFGPGDPYCGVWHLFALLGDSMGPDWQPKFSYE